MNPSPARIVALDGKLKGRAWDLEGPSILGRLPGAKIRVPDVKVSREHSKVYPQGVDWYVVDLNSRNGTQVNDANITKRLLQDGDVIMVGSSRFRFEKLSPPEPAAPAAPKVALKPKEAPLREVVDLTKPAASAPAGAIRADEIVVKERALQFSKKKRQKKPSVFFDDLGQRPFAYQLLMALVIIGACLAFLYVGLMIGGIIGGGGEG